MGTAERPNDATDDSVGVLVSCASEQISEPSS